MCPNSDRARLTRRSDATPRHDRLVLTSDKGFLTVDQEQHAGILFQPDDRLSAHEIAQIITRISEHLPQDDLTGVIYVTRDWL